MTFSNAVIRLRTLIFISLLFAPLDFSVAQNAAPSPRIVQSIDDRQLVTLKGNVHPLARPEFDRGPALSDFNLNRMLLVLKRSSEQELALRKLLDDQQDRSSPSYRKWLTPEQFGQQFGPADADIQKIVAWLESHGFHDLHVG